MILNQESQKRMLSPAAAKYLGFTTMTMTNWRKDNTGPRYYKIGGRYFYTAADLQAFIEACAVDPAA